MSTDNMTAKIYNAALDNDMHARARLDEHAARCGVCIGGGDCYTSERLLIALRRAEAIVAKAVA